MEIVQLVDKLEEMVGQARKMPMTGRSMVDAERLLELVDQMRLALPRNLHEAREVLERREQIVNQTMLDARRIRATAEGDARALVEESELMKSAKRRADEIIEEAGHKAERIISVSQQEARRRQEGADAYCREILDKAEEQLNAVLESVRAGQRVLNPMTDFAPQMGEESALSFNPA